MAANRTIVLQGDLGRWRGEKYPNATGIKPGMLIEYMSTEKVRPASVAGGKSMRLFAVEDSYQGRTIDDAYDTVDSPVFFHKARDQDLINSLLGPGENITLGDYAANLGNGYVGKAGDYYLANTVADSATLTSWTTEVAFSNSSIPIAANSLHVGDVIRCRGQVVILSANSTDTVTIRLLLNALVGFTTGAVDITTGDICEFTYDFHIRTIGATGTVTGNGTVTFGVPGTAVPTPKTLASSTIDTTAAATVALKAACSVSNANNQAVLRNFTVEHLIAGSGGNPGVGDVLGQFEETLNNSASLVPAFCALRIG